MIELINGKWHRYYYVHRVMKQHEVLHGDSGIRKILAQDATDALTKHVLEFGAERRVHKVVVAATGEVVYDS